MTSASCSVSKGDFPLNISWVFNETALLSGSNGIVISQVNKRLSTLSIESVQAEHVGVYQCVARNRAGENRQFAYLHVNGNFCFLVLMIFYFLLPLKKCFPIVAPQILPFDFGEESVNSGDVASLQCTVFKGDLPLNITWLHNNQTIGYNNGISVTRVGKKVSSITIDSVQGEHAGVYTCFAGNQAGFSSHSTYLHVNGKIL